MILLDKEIDRIQTFGALKNRDMCLCFLKKKDVHFAADRSQVWLKNYQTLLNEPYSFQYLMCCIDCLKSWRKGPFVVEGITIDAEWKCDIKWNRLKPIHNELKGKTVLDVGCGNGYFLFEMAKLGAKLVVGVDPTIQFFMQYQLIQHFYQNKCVAMLPLGWQQLNCLNSFDILFCMGILYHCSDPVYMLKQLKDRCNEYLILETLVDSTGSGFKPKNKRYACMRLIYEVPSLDTLKSWVTQAGFTQIDMLNIEPTTSNEQRSTQWSGSFSFQDTLDVNDETKTVEGYPAPVRAIFRCFVS